MLPVLLVMLCLLAPSGAGARSTAGGAVEQALRELSRPLRSAADLDPLIAATAQRRVVLLGEASHGTHDYLVWRARLSRRLVEEQGFAFVAIEGDWSSLVPLDRYVRHLPGAPASARDALASIERWPTWVWRNAELAAFAEWLRAFNQARPVAARVGVHGIDLYAVWESLDAVSAFYQAHLPAMAARVDQTYAPLAAFDGRYRDYMRYARDRGLSARQGLAWVTRDLAMRYQRAAGARREVLFDALQHALVVEAGERYMRLESGRGPHGWNARSLHFASGIARLLRHYGPPSRAVVWAHNTHVGDARATAMASVGEVNAGQLLREWLGADGVLVVGFGTATGSVVAARKWEGRPEVMAVPLPRADSLEAALLRSGRGDRLLMLDGAAPALRPLRRMLPHRAIGVVFEPEHEARQNYVPSRLAARYDAFIFLPRTRAIEPLPAD